MKPHHLFLLLFFFLASCAPSMPAPTIPTATSTLTPVPTITPTATPEPWIAIVDEYGLSEEIAKELGAQDFMIEDALYGQALKDETGTVLFEEIRGEWLEAKNYEWVTTSENFKDSFIPWEEVLAGSLYAWAVRAVIPNVKYESNGDGVKLRGYSKSGHGNLFPAGYSYLFMVGYPESSIKGAAYLHTNYKGRDYRVIVGVLEGEGGKGYPIIRVAEYYGNDKDHFDEFWEQMRIAPIVLGSIDFWENNHPFVTKSHELMGEDLVVDDLKEYIPEKAAQWEGIDAPIGSMFALLDILTPKQLAEFKPGEGGAILAIYMYKKGDPSFISYPGLVFYTNAALSTLYE